MTRRRRRPVSGYRFDPSHCRRPIARAPDGFQNWRAPLAEVSGRAEVKSLRPYPIEATGEWRCRCGRSVPRHCRAVPSWAHEQGVKSCPRCLANGPRQELLAKETECGACEVKLRIWGRPSSRRSPFFRTEGARAYTDDHDLDSHHGGALQAIKATLLETAPGTRRPLRICSTGTSRTS